MFHTLFFIFFKLKDKDVKLKFFKNQKLVTVKLLHDGLGLAVYSRPVVSGRVILFRVRMRLNTG